MKLLTSLLFFLSTAVVATSSANGYGNKDGCPLNYPEFESNVAHFDLPKCPDSENVSLSDGFCRLSLIGDKAYLYTFKSMKGTVCLTAAKEVPLADYLSK